MLRKPAIRIAKPLHAIHMKLLFWNIKKKGLQLTDELKTLSKDVDILIISELTGSKKSLEKLNKTIQDVIDSVSKETGLTHIQGKENSWIHVWIKEKKDLNIELVEKYNNLKSPSDLTDIHVENDSEYFAQYLNRFERMIFLKINYKKLDFLLVPIHFPSRIYATVRKQKDIAVHFRKFIEKIESKFSLPSLIVGDFNMNPFEDGMIHHEGFHALPYQEMEESINFYETPYKTFYNPSWSKFGDHEIKKGVVQRKPAGSYYYESSRDLKYYWYVLDQVIMRKELIDKFQFDEFKYVRSIYKNDDLLKGNLIPNEDKYSDHLPLAFKLKN